MIGEAEQAESNTHHMLNNKPVHTQLWPGFKSFDSSTRLANKEIGKSWALWSIPTKANLMGLQSAQMTFALCLEELMYPNLHTKVTTKIFKEHCTEGLQSKYLILIVRPQLLSDQCTLTCKLLQQQTTLELVSRYFRSPSLAISAE